MASRDQLHSKRTEGAQAARRRRLRYAVGALVAAVAVAVVILLDTGAIGGDGGEVNRSHVVDDFSVHVPQESDVREAAKAAGCEFINTPYEGTGHEERKFTKADFKTNPPTSGAHSPTWYEDGEYQPGEVPDLGQLVHTLEHGRINVQYRKGTPPEVVDQLRAFMKERNGGYHMLLYENTTGMPYEVAATAWTHLLGCQEWTPKAIDALRRFHQRYIDKGPERVP